MYIYILCICIYVCIISCISFYLSLIYYTDYHLSYIYVSYIYAYDGCSIWLRVKHLSVHDAFGQVELLQELEDPQMLAAAIRLQGHLKAMFKLLYDVYLYI